MVTYTNIYRYLYIHRLGYKHISLLCQLKGTERNNIQSNIPNAWYLMLFSNKKNHSFHREMGAGNNKMNPEHFVVPKIKEVKKEKKDIAKDETSKATK